ncbi:hypothetical protein [Thermoproteus tenax]|uniref:Uncharacterized protein n=1 Tax=Thermoproteus tenax (strain ATCC 35583 / DSM 2078 / JCM 9277 / NBRC 100435 / Kra 1) TaxID=768679 RepID=G4RN72_THETK|nr:hypothetical protein [Thermoproteus tenax]CCC81016.1 hypothetical protein TTX_0341 [Thermoproteus tenax Kra 1]
MDRAAKLLRLGNRLGLLRLQKLGVALNAARPGFKTPAPRGIEACCPASGGSTAREHGRGPREETPA